jgi:hypothetical protein
MVEGLVISKDIALFEEFNINFSDEKNSLEYANTASAAKDLISMEMPDYLVVMEESADKIQEILKELYVEEEVKKIPVICLIPSHQWKNRNMLWQMGVKDIISLPISKEEMKFQLEKLLETTGDISIDQDEAGMNGKLEDYSLLDLIQILSANKKTGILNLFRSREEGKVWFQDGNIHNAAYRTFGPVEAILKLISWTEGDFMISFDEEKYDKVIEADTQEILLMAIQHIDDRNRMLETLPHHTELLLISPEVDMEKMSEEKVNFLRYFHGGNTIAGYLDAFDHSDHFLLEIVSEFVEKKYLMTRNEFEEHISEQDIQFEGTGIKKVLKRFFARKDDNTGESISAPKLEEIEQMDEDLFNDPQIRRFKYHFRRDTQVLERFLKKIENL